MMTPSTSPTGGKPFATKRLASNPSHKAPDGTDVRVLLQLSGGSLAHFELAPGQTSVAVTHRTVEEIWFFVGGRGELWRTQRDRAEVTPVEAGISVSIPLGTAFQFRSLGSEPLAFVVITMPAWPGDDEAFKVDGPWLPSDPAS